jgi:DNA-binding transcriptional regulator YiaG
LTNTTAPTTPARRHTVDLDAARAHHHAATTTGTTDALWLATTDVPVLLAEIDRCRTLLALTRARHADLLAASRATVAAYRDGEADPLWYVRDELTAHGQHPPAHLHPTELLAQAVPQDGRR